MYVTGIKIMMKKPLDLASNLHHLYTYVSLTSSHLLEHRKNVKNWQFMFFFVCMLHSIFKIIWSTGLFSENNSIDLMKINLHINFSLIEVKNIQIPIFTNISGPIPIIK